MPRLEYIDNSGSRAVVDLSPGLNVSIGRNPGSTIQTANPSVSRNHARVWFAEGVWNFKDLGSSNGSYLNDDPQREGRLKPTDRLRCGDFVISFIDEASGEAPRPARPSEPSRAEAPPSRTIAPSAADRSPSTRAPSVDLRATRAPSSRAEPPPSRAEPPRSEPPRSEAPRSESAPSRADARAHGEERLVAQIKEQGSEIHGLHRDLTEARAMVKDLEVKLVDWEGRAKRYEVELDSVTEKYVQLKDQLTLTKERLDEAREEIEERNERVFQLEAKNTELEVDSQAARERASSNQEYVSQFKIKVTQKERQIEDLQRQYDLLEFDLRAKSEENRLLVEERDSEFGDTQKLERRINQLREVISDKENVISELRLELENKDIEIRQIRMGVGMSSLEDEKRKLLEDYYAKVREVDELRGRLDKSKMDRTESEQKLKEALAEVERKSQAFADIASHPEFKAKAREATRLDERLKEVEAELAGAQQRLSEFTADEKKRLQGEVAFYKRKSATIEDKLAGAQARAQELERDLDAARAERDQLAVPAPETTAWPSANTGLIQSPYAAAPGPSAEVLAEVDALFEMFEQLRGNFRFLKRYVQDLEGTVSTSAPATDPAAIDPREVVDSMRDLLSVVESDAGALKSGLQRLQKHVGAV